MTYEEIEAAIMCRIENLLAQEETDSYYEEKNARALESYLRALQIIKNIQKGVMTYLEGNWRDGREWFR